MKPLYVVLIVIIILLIVGYFTNWFSMGNRKAPLPKLMITTPVVNQLPDNAQTRTAIVSNNTVVIPLCSSANYVSQLALALYNFNIANQQQIAEYNNYCSNKIDSNLFEYNKALNNAKMFANTYNALKAQCSPSGPFVQPSVGASC